MMFSGFSVSGSGLNSSDVEKLKPLVLLLLICKVYIYKEEILIHIAHHY